MIAMSAAYLLSVIAEPVLVACGVQTGIAVRVKAVLSGVFALLLFRLRSTGHRVADVTIKILAVLAFLTAVQVFFR